MKFGLHFEEKAGINGLLITDVDPEMPAGQAGVRVNDILITINDVNIRTTADLDKVKYSNASGEKVKIIVKRGGEQLELEVFNDTDYEQINSSKHWTHGLGTFFVTISIIGIIVGFFVFIAALPEESKIFFPLINFITITFYCLMLLAIGGVLQVGALLLNKIK